MFSFAERASPISGARTVHGGYALWSGHGTSLTIDGQVQEDDHDGHLRQQVPVVGDALAFTIPSGTFSGTVEHVRREPDDLRVIARGVWDGKYGGLTGGLSCYGVFELLGVYSDVDSSWGTIPFEVYELIRRTREVCHVPDQVAVEAILAAYRLGKSVEAKGLTAARRATTPLAPFAVAGGYR